MGVWVTVEDGSAQGPGQAELPDLEVARGLLSRKLVTSNERITFSVTIKMAKTFISPWNFHIEPVYTGVSMCLRQTGA